MPTGLYCTWTIRGEPGKALSLTFLDANILPLSTNCDHDGVVVYDGNDMHGRCASYVSLLLCI